MIPFTFRPIDKWPREFTKERKKRSPFGQFAIRQSSTNPDHTRRTKGPISFDNLTRELAAEAERTGANRVVIQLALPMNKIRQDGLPYSDARPDHPGVIVAFETKHGPVKMPCDAFADWKDNLRAITLTLEHLRGVDRYGVSTHGEQYRGWTALPPGPGGEARMTAHEAATWLSQQVGFIGADWIVDNADAYRTAYKEAAKKLHPDKEGGDPELFKKLQTAAAVLDVHHGEKS